MTLSTRQINEQGKELVRSKFIAHGVEISDSHRKGYDFLAFSSICQKHLKIKVTANEKAKPAAGKGRLSLDWWVQEETEADVIAFTDIDSGRVWLMQVSALADTAQQHSSTHYHFFMYVDPSQPPRRDGKKHHDHEFSEFLVERSLSKIF